MRLAEHLYGLSRMVQAMSAWLVKPRRTPSRHSRYARVYGHTTTAMHNLITTPPHAPAPYLFGLAAGVFASMFADRLSKGKALDFSQVRRAGSLFCASLLLLLFS